MSYILDALKKLEHEKTRKNRGSGMVDISGALFENERSRPPASSGWKIALGVTTAVLLTFGATWYFLQPGKVQNKPAPRMAATVPVAPPVRIDTPATPAVSPVAPAPQTPPAPPVTPAAPAQVAPLPQSAQSSKTAVVAQTEDDTENVEASRTKRGQRKLKNDPRVQVLTAEQGIAAPADIKLSGIAWQDERRARRVVVNGFLMQEGGVVSGARITDIFQDRVRFSLSGKVFEIPLVSSTLPAAGK